MGGAGVNEVTGVNEGTGVGEGNGKWLSEDLLFCDRVQRAGIKIHAHTGAVMPHHKSMWVVESHYDDWLKKQDIR